jgi:hypothetical protein
VSTTRTCLLFDKLLSFVFFYLVGLFSQQRILYFERLVALGRTADGLTCYSCTNCPDSSMLKNVAQQTVSDTEGYSCAVSQSLFTILYQSCSSNRNIGLHLNRYFDIHYCIVHLTMSKELVCSVVRQIYAMMRARLYQSILSS